MFGAERGVPPPLRGRAGRGGVQDVAHPAPARSVLNAPHPLPPLQKGEGR
jgi:hypothetical protein